MKNFRNHFKSTFIYKSGFLIGFIFFQIIFIDEISGQVINDNPCDTLPGGPFDLSVVLSDKGSTCGAMGYSDDTLADFPNYFCNKSTEENAVWYKYKFRQGSEGIQIDVLPITNRGKPAIEIYFGYKGLGCSDTLTNFKAGHCDSLPAKFIFGSCDYYGEYAFIKIASTEVKCDSFQIIIKEIVKNCNIAERCSDITEYQTLNPITGDDLDYVCAPGCLKLSCPENPGPEGCDFSKTPTVWYYIDTDALAAQLFTTVESNSGTWQPIWSVFFGNCDSLINAATGNAGPCSNGDDSPDIHQIGAENAVEGYYIAITYDPKDPPTDGDTGFTICAATIKSQPEIEINLYNYLICSGESINLEVRKLIDLDYRILVFPVDNPKVEGEKFHIFTGSYGIVNDTLNITDQEIDSPQIVEYIIYAETSNNAYRIANKFIIIYPRLWIENLSKIPEYCSTSLPETLKINGHSSFPGILSYNWEDNVYGLTGNDNIIHIDNSFSPGTHNLIINLTDQMGCSTTDTLLLKINDIDTSVTKSENTLTSNQSEAQYQWLNCYAAYANIIGETGQSFTPLINGSYAVEISKDGCIDTSMCHKVIITGIAENSFGEQLKIYPNPTDGKINIEFSDVKSEVSITITDALGKELTRQKLRNISSASFDLNKPSGIYFVKIRSGDINTIVKVLKQ